MRKFAGIVLSVFAGFSAFADARLPIVNVGAAGVSARAAFGEAPIAAAYKVKPKPVAEDSFAAKVERIAVSAPAAAPTFVSSDVLTPRRPSSDLWARNNNILRMPDTAEFAVLKSDFELPEESLDAQIDKLVDLQRKADESVRTVARPAPAPMPRPSRIVSAPKPAPAPAPKKVKLVVNDRDEIVLASAPVKLSRVVVPMDEPIIRPVQTTDREPSVMTESSLAQLSPSELKKAFKKTYMSENKHLSTYPIDDRFDVASESALSAEGFTAVRDLSEEGGVRPLEIKISFRGDDSALSRDNYNLLSEYAAIIVSNPRRAIQVSIPERMTRAADSRKVAARRLAIVEQVLKDTGVSDGRIMPVLSARADDGFVLRVISNDQFETMTQQKRDMFGDTISNKSYKSLSW